MTSVLLGVDCGTSYIKGTLSSVDGGVLCSARIPAPPISIGHDDTPLFRVAPWWSSVLTMIRELLDRCAHSPIAVNAACISAISPVLVAFDPDVPEQGLAFPYWHLPTVDGERRGLRRTQRRIQLIRHRVDAENWPSFMLGDLVSYLNYRLASRLVINTAALSELGFTDEADARAALDPLSCPSWDLSAPDGICGGITPEAAAASGLRPGTPVVVGGPDSFATVLEAGLKEEVPSMVYLGTFGSLLRLRTPIDQVLASGLPTAQPYEWIVSVPGFGPHIEQKSRDLFMEASTGEALHRMDRAAVGAEPGSGGLYLLPIWDRLGRERGSFGFADSSTEVDQSVSRTGRAVLESIGYATLALGGLDHIPGSRIVVAGGGSRSPEWVSILAEVMQVELLVPENTGVAAGATLIAACATDGPTTSRLRRGYRSFIPSGEEPPSTIPNKARAIRRYRRLLAR